MLALVVCGEDERKIIEEDNIRRMNACNNSFPFEFIGFSVTKKCNFACKYCIAGSNTIRNDNQDFPLEVLYENISKFAEELIENGKSTLNIGFTGGEPLTYWNNLRKVIIRVFSKYRNDLDINIFINTNLSLMTEEIASFFEEYNFHPSTSLDGVENWNDKVRIYKSGAGTFLDIVSGIKTLRKHNVLCDGFYITLTKDNFGFDINELIRFAKENDFVSITIEPDLVDIIDISISELCDKLIECYEIGKENGIDVVGFWKRPFNNMFNYEDSSSGFCRALDFKSIVVDREGFIAPCGYSITKITKTDKYAKLMKNESYRNYIYNNLRGNIEKCKGCRIEGMCKGGCLISREAAHNDKVFEYRCELYKKMTDLLLRHAEFE